MEKLNISEQINHCILHGARNLHISIFIHDQILFQIVPAHSLIKHGALNSIPNSFAAIHFFNKNKTLTYEKINKFKNTELGQGYYYFEDPKNNHNYVKEIGVNASSIEEYINECIRNIYELNTLESLTIDYTDY